ncbi:unnamed protein product, partial [Meganyctiphanes norvegica]
MSSTMVDDQHVVIDASASCSKEHQLECDTQYQDHCSYYKLVHTEQLGRHLVANCDISAGTSILIDHPLVVGPSVWAKLVCLGCNDAIDPLTVYVCSKCLWPLCSEKCENSVIHKPECEILSKDSTESRWGHPMDLTQESPLYDLIIVIRCLLLRSQNPQAWKLLETMVSHSEKRMSNKLDPHHKGTVEFIKRHLVKDDFERNEISHVRGVIYSNAIAYSRKSRVRLRALYPVHSMINHSCLPNLHLSITDDGSMQVRATVDIKKNEMLTDTYTGTVVPFWERQNILNDTYYFTCNCLLCIDPTELGSYFSSHRCLKCPGFFMCPKIINNEINVLCNNCNDSKTLTNIKQDLDKWETRLKLIDIFGKSSPHEVEMEIK